MILTVLAQCNLENILKFVHGETTGYCRNVGILIALVPANFLLPQGIRLPELRPVTASITVGWHEPCQPSHIIPTVGDQPAHCRRTTGFLAAGLEWIHKQWVHVHMWSAMDSYAWCWREIKFIGLFGDRGHQDPYSPYKPCNNSLYIGMVIFPHIDNPQSTGYD